MMRTIPSPLLAFALVVITTLVYVPGLTGGFLFDDYPNIVSNANAHATKLDAENLARAAHAYDAVTHGRPLATISLAIDHVYSGLAPYRYKVTGLVVHLVNVLLVFALLLQVLRATSIEAPRRTMTAALLALAWGVHPLQVSTVLYIVQRMETLSLLFVLAALLCYTIARLRQIDGVRAWPCVLACAPLMVLGLASKESALLLPVFTFVLEIALFRFRAASPGTARTWRVFYALGVVAGVTLAITVVIPMYATAEAYAGRDYTATERLLTQARVLVLYLQQIVLPLSSSMTFYYDDYTISHGFLDPASTALATISLGALLGSAFVLRQRLPLYTLGILWFFAAHLITSSIVPLELVFEHRNYFALLGIVLAIYALATRLPATIRPRLATTLATMLLVTLAGLATLRSATWGDPLRLAVDLTQKNPSSSRAANDLAAMYIGMSKSDPSSRYFELGRREFVRSAGLSHASPLADQGLILMAATVGQPVESAWWDRLLHKARTRPTSSELNAAVSGLVSQRYAGIDLDDRRLAEVYEALASRSRLYPYIYAMFGDHALKYLHDEALADRMFMLAVDRDPSDAAFAMRVYTTLTAEGHQRQANLVRERVRAHGKPDLGDLNVAEP